MPHNGDWTDKLMDIIGGIFGAGCMGLGCLWQIGTLLATVLGILFFFMLIRGCTGC